MNFFLNVVRYIFISAPLSRTHDYIYGNCCNFRNYNNNNDSFNIIGIFAIYIICFLQSIVKVIILITGFIIVVPKVRSFLLLLLRILNCDFSKVVNSLAVQSNVSHY